MRNYRHNKLYLGKSHLKINWTEVILIWGNWKKDRYFVEIEGGKEGFTPNYSVLISTFSTVEILFSSDFSTWTDFTCTISEILFIFLFSVISIEPVKSKNVSLYSSPPNISSVHMQHSVHLSHDHTGNHAYFKSFNLQRIYEHFSV